MPIQIHGNEYYTVAERIKEFHAKYPNGSISTEIIEDKDTKIIKCTAIVTPDVANLSRLFMGHAEELRGSTMINKTSALENCETSAVGRALGFLGIGSDTSIASADEVKKAIEKQEEPFSGTPEYEKVKDEMFCDLCGEKMIKKNGIKGQFWGCTGYKNGCRNTKSI